MTPKRVRIRPKYSAAVAFRDRKIKMKEKEFEQFHIFENSSHSNWCANFKCDFSETVDAFSLVTCYHASLQVQECVSYLQRVTEYHKQTGKSKFFDHLLWAE